MPKADTLTGVQKLQPLGDNVVVKPVTKEEKTSAFGIIIPESADTERPAKGKVIAVGPGKVKDGKLVPMNVKVGQQVLFSNGYGDIKEVTIEGEEYYVLTESSILAIITK